MRYDRSAHIDRQLPLAFSSLRSGGRLLRYARYTRRRSPTAKDFEIPLRVVFSAAAQAAPHVEMHRDILGGTPCISGTRIPVYMILDAIEYTGTLRGALRSYPQLQMKQIKGAVRFAKLISESPLGNKTPSAAG
jgi:uncharacterized protein (DUF433 family)